MPARRNIMELIRLMKATPWLTQKGMSLKLRVDQRQIQKWLIDLEVEVRRGVEPSNGRRNVKTYAISLPADKLAAVTP